MGGVDAQEGSPLVDAAPQAFRPARGEWSPVGECPIELGPLAVLPGSHKIGRVREHHFSLGAGGQALNSFAFPDRGVPGVDGGAGTTAGGAVEEDDEEDLYS